MNGEEARESKENFGLKCRSDTCERREGRKGGREERETGEDWVRTASSGSTVLRMTSLSWWDPPAKATWGEVLPGAGMGWLRHLRCGRSTWAAWPQREHLAGSGGQQLETP